MKKIMTGAMLFMALPLAAQKQYTLDALLTMADRHNMNVRTADANVAMAQEQQKEAFTKYFPTLSASGLGMTANHDVIQMELSGMGVGLMKNGVGAGVTAVQPVFAGGQIVNSNKLARVNVEAQQILRQQKHDEVALTTEQYYWNVVTLHMKIKTVETVKSMLVRLEKDADVAVKAGVGMRNDLLQVQLRKNDIESKRIALENALQLSKMLLAQYVGLDAAGFDVQTDTLSAGGVPAFPMTLKQEHRAALKNTSEYRLLEKNVESKELARRLEIGKNLPSVGVGASYTYNNLLGTSYGAGMLFATVSVPISGWWGGTHAVRRQKIALVNAREQLTDNSELLLIGMQKNWNDVEDAYKQLVLADESIVQAKENLRLNNDYYRAGTSKMTDVLDAQTLYQQACDQYVDAYSKYQTKTTEYRRSVGQM